jgi:2-keto-4-pentenoate hydratase
MTEAREKVLLEAVAVLQNARRNHAPIEDLPKELQPENLDEAYFVQNTMAKEHGPIGGWKIGAPSPDVTPFHAPLPLKWITSSGSLLDGERHRLRILEAEIAFKIGKDLPPRTTPYTREEVIAAVESCHPAIEVLESGLVDPSKAAKMSMFADMQIHGGFVYGPSVVDWQNIDWNAETVTLIVDGKVEVERTGSNTSGDLVGLLPYLANQGAARTGGLKRGDWVTTGTWTGNTPAKAGSPVEVRFGNAGQVTLRFA